jgi:8-amino-7-oxononanoate synthase
MEELTDLYLDGKPGRTAVVSGKEYLFFSGYNYLGVNSDAEFIELILEGTAKYGWLYPSARISNTRLAVYEECEALLSTITGMPDTVLLPSGFAAGRVASSYHQGVVNNAPGSHPAILQHKPTVTDFSDWRKWVLSQSINTDIPLVIASDSVNPLTSTIHDFSFLSDMHIPVTAILDDSHGMGIIGADGSGVSSLVPQNDQVNYLFAYSLSKAFGISGGAISCTREQVQQFKTMPEYSAVTPMSPAQVFAFIKGQHIYSRQRERLQSNITYFEACVKDLPGIQHHAGLPVFVLPTFINEAVFMQHNILISSFAYPDPKGKTLKRIVLNALHTTHDLDLLTLILQNAYQAST